MRTLRKDAEKKPIQNIIIIFMLCVGIVCFPTKDICMFLFGEYTINHELFSVFLARILFSVAIIFLIKEYMFTLPFKVKPSIKSLIIILPCLIVAINNAPIVGYINGTVKVTGNLLNIVFFVLYCIGIATFEEVAFRGLIFPLTLIACKKNKNGLFLAIIISSALFGLLHIVNLFGGSSIGAVLLQVGYSFLIGAMCVVTLIVTKSIYVPIIIHTIYDIAGMMVDKIGVGSFSDIWNTAEIIITAILAVAVIIYVIIIFVKMDKKSIFSLYEISENKGE